MTDQQFGRNAIAKFWCEAQTNNCGILICQARDTFAELRPMLASTLSFWERDVLSTALTFIKKFIHKKKSFIKKKLKKSSKCTST